MTDLLERPVITDEDISPAEDFVFPLPGEHNLKELRRQVEWIKRDAKRQKSRRRQDEPPEDGIVWHQESWIVVDVPDAGVESACHTYACLAGHTVLSNGATIIRGEWDTRNVNRVAFRGMRFNVSDLATRMLGLSPREADAFFSGSNSVERLEALVNALENDIPIYEIGYELY